MRRFTPVLITSPVDAAGNASVTSLMLGGSTYNISLDANYNPTAFAPVAVRL